MRAHAEERSRDAHVCGADCRIHARRVRQAHVCGPGCSHGASVARIASTGPVSAGFFASDDFAPAPSTGRSLPDGPVARSLGALAAGVRVHEGVEGLGRATAVTEGTDIMLAPSAPAPGTAAGDLLLAHEAAHVRQQAAGARGGPTVSRERAEQLADDAAVAAVAGRPVHDVGAYAGEQAFEAPIHQATLTAAMERHGFTDDEQEQAYFANWCRDVSQAFIPLASGTIGMSATMGILQIVSQWKFGHSVTPDQMRAYDPRHHIDNPAGQTDRDLAQRPGQEIRLPGYGPDDPAGVLDSGQDVYDLRPEAMADAFRVGADGVPEYINRSREYIVEELDAAVDAGRTGPGLFHMGNASHTLEDLFAHSNWVEMAVGKLIGDGAVNLTVGAQQEVDQRRAQGMPPIENFAPDIRDAAGDVRPVLQTGTFSGGSAGHDTIISLKAEVTNIISRSPFAEGHDDEGQLKWDVVLEVLRNMDRTVQEGQGGEVFVSILEQLGSNLVQLASQRGASMQNERHDPAEQGERNLWDRVREGAGELLHQGAQAVRGVAGRAWDGVVRDLVRRAIDRFGSAGLQLEMLAVYLEKGETWIAETWKSLRENAASALPDFLRELIIPRIVAAEEAFKQQVRRTLDAAWQSGARLLISALEGMSPVTDKAETNVDVKFERLQERLREIKVQMEGVIREVVTPGERATELIAEMNRLPLDQLVPFLESGSFHQVMEGYGRQTMEYGRLAAMRDDMADTAHRAHQLSEVPEWARAGASHSQTAKDHETDPFFPAAFTLANHVDTEITGLMMEIWQADPSGRGQRPAEGFEGEYAQRDTEMTDEALELAEEQWGREHTSAEPWERPREVDDTGLTEAEAARRRALIETRRRGQRIVATGRPTVPDAGEEAVKAAERFDAVVRAYGDEIPLVRPALAQLAELLRQQDSAREIQAKIQEIRTNLHDGHYEDRVVDGINQALEAASRAAGLLARADSHNHGADPCPHEETQGAHDTNACPHQHGSEAQPPNADQSCPNDDLPQHDQVACTYGHGNETDRPSAVNPCEHDFPLTSPAHEPSRCPHPGDDEHSHQGMDLSHPDEPEGHHHGERSEDFYQSQIDSLNQFRGQGREMVRGPDGTLYTREEAARQGITAGDVRTARRPGEADAALPTGGDPKQRVRAYVERYFGHPYDTTWWVGTLTTWCNQNAHLLEAYIRRRNQGRGHDHNHPH